MMRSVCSTVILLLICRISPTFQDETSECLTKDNEPGICRNFHSCTWLLDTIKSNGVKLTDFSAIQHCGFIGKIPIVCCPIGSKKSKSERACNEYAEYVNPQANYILNGKATELGDYPFMAAIGRLAGPKMKYMWFCGGSLISKNFVLTAGHCVTSEVQKPSVVRLNDINLAEDSSTDITINVLQSIKHPTYNPLQQYDDIALLRLAKDVTFSVSLYPICLSTEPIEPGTIMTAIGFGITEERVGSNVLLSTELTIFDGADCNATYSDDRQKKRLPDKIRSSQFCANDPAGKANTCQGDSGGALERIVNGQHKIFGLTSFGLDCTFAKIPGVYTKVSSYLAWIEDIVW